MIPWRSLPTALGRFHFRVGAGDSKSGPHALIANALTHGAISLDPYHRFRSGNNYGYLTPCRLRLVYSRNLLLRGGETGKSTIKVPDDVVLGEISLSLLSVPPSTHVLTS